MNALHHQEPCVVDGKETVCSLFKNVWTPLIKGAYTNDALNVVAKNPCVIDPVFVFKSENSGWSGTQEPPRETDVLVFKNGGAGHFVIAEAAIPRGDKVHIPIIEENIAGVGSYGPPGSLPDPEDPSKMIDPFCHHRVLVASKKGEKWNVDSGIGYSYAGFIRHNLAGIYGDSGWKNDGTSQAFREAYLRFGTKLGWAFSDHDGTPFVHKVHGVWLQNFRSTDPANHFGTDGETAIAMGPASSAFLLKEGFWGAYKCIPGSDGKAMGGAEYLGAPLTDEKRGALDGRCGTGVDSSISVTYQLFENGCMWFRDQMDGKVHIHLNSGTKVDAAAAASCGVAVENNPPGADCTDECSPGTQECHPEGSSKLRICGTPGPDACRHWLDMSCASGLVCMADECVSASSVPSSSSQGGSSSTVTIATSSGSSSSGSGSASSGNASSTAAFCQRGAHRCVAGGPGQYEACIFDTSTGITDWMRFDCASGWLCTGDTGECNTPAPQADQGDEDQSDEDQGDAESSSEPTTSSSTSSSSADLRLSYTSPLCGPLHVEAWWENADGTTRSWAPVECADENDEDCRLDCVLPFPSDAARLEFQVFLPNGEGYGNEDCYNGGCGEPLGELHLSKGGKAVPFSLVSSQSGAPYYLISLSGGTGSSSSNGTASSGSSSATTPSSESSLASGSSSTPSSSDIRLSYMSPLCGALHVQAWWEEEDGTIRSWAPVECADENGTDCRLDCMLPFPSGAPYLEFQVFLPNGEGYGNEDCYKGGCGEPLGELHLSKGGEEVSFELVPSEDGAPYYLLALEPVP